MLRAVPRLAATGSRNTQYLRTAIFTIGSLGATALIFALPDRITAHPNTPQFQQLTATRHDRDEKPEPNDPAPKTPALVAAVAASLATPDPAPTEPQEGEGEHDGQAAYNPETGEINWDCPCLGGMADGPCGEDFKLAFACFVYSEQEPKGVDCVDKFRNMQDCFRKHPEIYGNGTFGLYPKRRLVNRGFDEFRVRFLSRPLVIVTYLALTTYQTSMRTTGI